MKNFFISLILIFLLQDLVIYCVVFIFIPIESSVIFWQNSPGNFARIHRGGPGHQAGGLNSPVAVIREQKTEQPPQDQFSNNLHPFVHFATNDVTVLDTNNQFNSEHVQFPFYNPVPRVENTFEMKVDEIDANDDEEIERKARFIEQNIKKSSELSAKIKILLRKKLGLLLPQLKEVEKTKVQEEDKRDRNPGSFLDNLIETMESLKSESNESEEFDELDDGLLFFKNAGLIRRKFNNKKDYESLESSSENNEFAKLLRQAGLTFEKKFDEEEENEEDSHPFDSFLEEEEYEVETERELLSQEVSELFLQLQGNNRLT